MHSPLFLSRSSRAMSRIEGRLEISRGLPDLSWPLESSVWSRTFSGPVCVVDQADYRDYLFTPERRPRTKIGRTTKWSGWCVCARHGLPLIQFGGEFAREAVGGSGRRC